MLSCGELFRPGGAWCARMSCHVKELRHGVYHLVRFCQMLRYVKELRHGVRRHASGCKPLWFNPSRPQNADPSLADAAERKLDELLARADELLAVQPSQPPTAAAGGGGKSGGEDVEMADAGAGEDKGKGKGKGSKGRGRGGSRGGRRRRGGGEEEQQEGGEAAAAQEQEEEDKEDEDPASLDDPTRLFNPRDGCR